MYMTFSTLYIVSIHRLTGIRYWDGISPLKVWQERAAPHPLGACKKCRVSGPTPGPLMQNPHFHKIPGQSARAFKFERLYEPLHH